jgi:tRNA pseudouridine32 synthase/23S rRNA pseudouridine746 synthase
VHIAVSSDGYAPDLLAASCQISKIAIKDAMQKGAVWLKRPGCKEQRIRKAKFLLQSGDALSLYYDAQILGLVPPVPHLVDRQKHYSVWYKPADLLTQGSRFGDHCSLLRHVERLTDFGTTVRLIHRLDREARGLVLLAHNQRAAGALSDLFQTREIEKRYWGVAHGRVGGVGEILCCDADLDGKAARTLITVKEIVGEGAYSILDILLETGRNHQIRRHLSILGHPLVGDSRYGRAESGTGLQLCAWFLGFTCPLTGKKRSYEVEPPVFSVPEG